MLEIGKYIVEITRNTNHFKAGEVAMCDIINERNDFIISSLDEEYASIYSYTYLDILKMLH